jgi:hypothetical protein
MTGTVRLAVAPALVALALTAPPAAAAPATVIEDDWPRALAEARAKDLPLFVDAWAPW